MKKLHKKLEVIIALAILIAAIGFFAYERFYNAIPVNLNQAKLVMYSMPDYVSMTGSTTNNAYTNNSGLKVTIQDKNIFFGDFNGDGVQDAFESIDITRGDITPQGGLYMLIGAGGHVKAYKCSGDGSAGPSDFSKLYMRGKMIVDPNGYNYTYQNHHPAKYVYSFEHGACIVREE